MAERDFTLNLVTDDEVDTTRAAGQLDQLGQAADTTAAAQRDLADGAGRAQGDLDRLSQAAQGAGRPVRDLGDDADRTRTQVRDLGDDADTTAAGTSSAFGDMRDEVGDSFREMGASFDGTMQSVLDSGQEAVANVGALFGPLGTFVGAGVAAGIGVIRAQAEKLKATTSELTTELIAGGGRIARDSLLGKLEQMAADGKLVDLAAQARDAKVPVGDFLAAVAGDLDAIERTNTALADRRDAIYEVSDAARAGAVYDTEGASAREEQRQAIEGATAAVNADAEARALATEAVQAYDAAEAALIDTAERGAQVQQAYTDALSGVTEEAGAMAEAIEAGIDAVLAAQERQITAGADFQENTTRVFEAVGQAGVDWALAQGENAEEAMQLLADAPRVKQQQVVANYAAVGRGAGAAVTAGIRAAAADAAAAATELVRSVQSGLDSRPLVVRTRIDPSGYDSGLRTIVRYGSVPV